MAKENVELIRRWAHVIEEADPSAWATMIEAIVAPNAEWIEDPRWPGSTTVKGREAINVQIQEYNEGFGWSFSVDDILEAGDDVVVLIKALGRGEASGIETQMEWAFLLTFVAGEIARWQIFIERSEALEAAGLRE